MGEVTGRPRARVAPLPLEGPIPEIAYYWFTPEDGRGYLIDPGYQGERLAARFRERGWQPLGILLTHGHFDHFGGVAEFRREYPVPVHIHQAGTALLEDPRLNLSGVFGEGYTCPGAETFREGDVFSLPMGPALEVLHTPGHTPDSCLFLDRENGLALVGDTVFKGSVGATHFPGGDEAALWRSIREKILTLPEETALYSGHSMPTTVRAEKAGRLC